MQCGKNKHLFELLKKKVLEFSRSVSQGSSRKDADTQRPKDFHLLNT